MVPVVSMGKRFIEGLIRSFFEVLKLPFFVNRQFLVFFIPNKKIVRRPNFIVFKKSKEGRLGKAKNFNCSSFRNCLFGLNSGF